MAPQLQTIKLRGLRKGKKENDGFGHVLFGLLFELGSRAKSIAFVLLF